jgi:hypothetical protein
MLPGLNFLTRSIAIVLLTLPSLSLSQTTTSAVVRSKLPLCSSSATPATSVLRTSSSSSSSWEEADIVAWTGPMLLIPAWRSFPT